jgi:6-phosphogluconolactonase
MSGPTAGLPEVRVHRDATLLARAVAARLVTRLVDVQAAGQQASLVLTGGAIGIQVLTEVTAAPARDAVDWRSLHIWWGDEAFLPSGDPARVETQARAALLDHVDVSQDRVHPMPSLDGPDGSDQDAAADRYASALRTAALAAGNDAVPAFDVLLLGIGPDAHVASLFPGMPALTEDGRSVVGVTAAPKPPPTRISLTLPAIRSARDVWIVAAGSEQADAVARALSSADPVRVPAAGARGRQQTLFLLDRDAAGRVQPRTDRIAQP